MKAIEKKLMPTKFPSYSMVGPYFYKILNNKRALVVCNEEDSPEISEGSVILALREGTKPSTKRIFLLAYKKVNIRLDKLRKL
jgi:hypothetical protein